MGTKLARTAVLAMALVAGAQAAGQQQLDRFESWAVLTWTTRAGEDVHCAQTALDAKHVLKEDDEGDHLRFCCTAASRPMPVLVLAEASGSALFAGGYTVDWRIGNLSPMSGRGQRMRLFDAFDAPEATSQLLQGERSNDLLVLRLSDPDRGTTRFERNLVGTEWPKVYAAELEGFKKAHGFVVDKCNEEHGRKASAGGGLLERGPETMEEAPEAVSGGGGQPPRSSGMADVPDSVRSSVVARCRESMGELGSAIVKACADQDLAAYRALAGYSGRDATINRCRRDMESYGWAIVKACVDQDVEAAKALEE